MKARKRKVRQWVRIVKLIKSNYAVIFTDEFGQVSGFDTHGHFLESKLAAGEARQLRLTEILHAKAFVRT